MTDSALARRILALIDLTSLNEADDEAAIRALARQAVLPEGKVAALCTWPRFIAAARAALDGSGIPIAAVANFPAGTATAREAAAEVAAAVADGADEIDVVFPYRALLAGEFEAGRALVRACRDACGSGVRLKVILETGQLTPPLIRAAADAAIAGGADFLKTSTGKTAPGATLEAASILLDAIAAAPRPGIGFKASGGVRSLAAAASYVDLFDRRFGPGSAVPANFRIGASSLLDEIRRALTA